MNTTRRFIVFLTVLSTFTLGGGLVRDSQLFACGDSPAACDEGEKCCEHKVGTFSADESFSSVHLEGQCVAKDQSCDSYWCGNRQCQSSWLLSKDVCCVYYPSENSPEYSCKGSEVSCRGNTARLTIRPMPTVASAELTDE